MGRSAERGRGRVRVCAITSSGLARRRLYITVAGTGLVDTKIKTTKINSEGLLRLFTKFSTAENYPLYGTMACADGMQLLLVVA